MNDQIRNRYLYGGVSKDEFDHVRQDILEHNRKRLLVYSLISVIILGIMVVITSLFPSLGFSPIPYLFPLSLILPIYLYLKKKRSISGKLLDYLILLFVIILFSAAIYIGTVASPHQVAGTFLAFLLTIPILFVMRPVTCITIIAFFDALFIAVVFAVKFPSIVVVDIVNSSIFGVVSILISQYFQSITIQNHVISQKMTFLASKDELTGLQNRTSYQKYMDEMSDNDTGSLGCIYADVNGLHELNNTQGHIAGDIMLKTIASIFSTLFGSDHTYRIGGDEFVGFTSQLSAEKVNELLEQFDSMVCQHGYHVSIGYAQSEDQIDITDLVALAEKRMYEAKQLFYQKQGNRKLR